MKETEVQDYNGMTKLEEQLNKDKTEIYSSYHHFHNAKHAPTTRVAAERFATEFLALCDKHLVEIADRKIRM